MSAKKSGRKSSRKSKGSRALQNDAPTYISLTQPALTRKTLLLIAKEAIQVEKVYQQFLKRMKERKAKEEELKESIVEIQSELDGLLKSLPNPPSKKKGKSTSKRKKKTTAGSKKPRSSSHLDALERQIKQLEKRIDSI